MTKGKIILFKISLNYLIEYFFSEFQFVISISRNPLNLKSIL